MPIVRCRRFKLFRAGLLMTASVLLRALHVIGVLLSNSSGGRGSSSSSSSSSSSDGGGE
ncbi:putative membrane protein YgcG [Streptomyces sp. V3I8]|uniref:hypothetical protein n=1 Tax=Streptomyces sp. V3I8 TaxID=3042279 RepID=UPI00278743A5|nr:hypothetical protein [Streptomyces sp. V3I8]MDQ1037183.1 putative membrane protein YgcG [Streptomyces sp. V3I8]